MNKVLKDLSLLLLYTFVVWSCTGEDDNFDDGFNSENYKVAETKWILKNWDFSVGDDYIGTIDETYNLYFYSSTEGLLYYGRKDLDSDMGSSSERSVAFFTYNVSGNKIKLEYLTDEIFTGFNILELNGDKISVDGFDFQKDVLSNSDQAWLSTLHGVTGDCKWYYNMAGTIWVLGEGEMYNYQSYSSTPWCINNCDPNVVIIEEGVTSVGAYAFANPSVAEVDLPRSLTKINKYAFSGTCIGDIDFGDDIVSIGSGAFYDCKYLQGIFMPKNVESIEDFAFANCESATLYDTKKIKRIGANAFVGCNVTSFTESEVLEEIGSGAFTNLSINKLILPNSLKKIGALAFVCNLNEIHIGSGLKDVTGTPFYPSKSGRLYVDISKPISLSNSFLEPASGWTLYVPKGCRTSYSKSQYWKDFESIIEDETLDSDGSELPETDDDDVVEGGDGEGGSGTVVIPQTYSNNGKTYKWIKVESPTIPTFYIMQTELNPNSNFRIGDDGDIGLLNQSGDVAITKAEFRGFLEKIKEVTGLDMRLPTTEEWMYAASGGNRSLGYIYSGSNDISEVAWYNENSQDYAHYFAMKAPNELGLYDMSGNYGEVCSNNFYDTAIVDGPIYGGCWSDNASDCKITSYKEGVRTGRIPGTTIKELNAFDLRKIAVRLVFNLP